MFPFWPYSGDADPWGRRDRGPAQPPDSDLVDEVLARAVADGLTTSGIHGRRLRITVHNRVVILEGIVDSVEVKCAAGRLAWAASGVFDVCNRLTARH